MTDAEQTTSRNRSRSRSSGKQILVVAGILAAINAAVVYSTGRIDRMGILVLILATVVGLIALLAPESRFAQNSLAQSDAFIDLPGDRVFLWTVPFSLRHHYVGTDRPYRRYALIAAAIAGVLAIALAIGRSADRTPWYIYVVLPVGIQAIAFASAWAQTGLAVGV